mgnify:CR=1 FL=1
MKHPSERLSELITALGHNINSFSVKCNYKSMNSLWSIISKKKTPSSPTYDKICDAFPLVNRGWLATGEGEMFIERPKETNKEDLTTTSTQVIAELNKKLKEQSDLIISNMLRVDLVHEAQTVISKLSSVLNDFESIQRQGQENKEFLSEINEKLTSIEFKETVKIIKEAAKRKENGGLDMN